MSKSNNKSSMYIVILLVVVAAGVITVVSSFASTPNEGAAVSDQNVNISSDFSQQTIDALENN
jgi:hypothetical protein